MVESIFPMSDFLGQVNIPSGIDEALRLASFGWVIIPINPANGLPYSNDEVACLQGLPEPERGSGGFHLATRDEKAIQSLWKRWPNAEIGIATGSRSGIYVLDIDRKNGKDGFATLTAMGLDPQTFWTNTRSGGRHYFYALQPDKFAKSDTSGLGAGIDRKGDGGFVRWYGAAFGTSETAKMVTAPEWMFADSNGASPQGNDARHELGSEALKAPSLSMLQRALGLCDIYDLSRDEWVRFSAAWKQAGWTLADPDTLRRMWDAWAEQYEGNTLAERDKLWNSIRDSELGWTYIERELPVLMVERMVPSAPGAPATCPSPALFWSAADLDGRPVPTREWLVDGLIPARTVTLLSGDGGTGKSLLSLQLAAAVALGHQWLRRATKAGRALFISAEDERDELHRRLADIAREMHASLGAMDGLTMASLAGGDALLAEMRHGSTLAETALYRQLVGKLTETRPALLVLDTLADLFPGDENNRVQARQFLQMLMRLALRFDCAVLMLSHPSLTGINTGTGTSGSTGWNNSVRSRLYFERGDKAINPDARMLRVMKANYGPTGDEIELRWQRGVFVEPMRGSKADRADIVDRTFLEVMQEFERTGQPINPSTGPTCYTVKIMDNTKSKAIGLKKPEIKEFCQRLLENGKLKIINEGRHLKLT